ncbi:hypothetical protein A2483_05130 [Candidatus Peregrinibacteria bacterium RIFOXYC2_FULL_33_13]|nr:MAG: RNA polymerase, sigma-24 subunit, ECF subfamily [Candidatus Peregrinibacteria bacterium GW2011_GWA2_33_10]KKP39542.1 MAG: RNA polymerase, sigma-24 subunit, ecf subfamily, RNA polymerase sigma-70 factor, ECF subfamily [Candidatus Peregrinibacteria bacterium GW2011_GWC2_33_13]OGJ48892.1 MAG: hypothetical protein A2229_00515 [Candidatus Peregrinibacteria bacterium RIFOXYA2_FULL_33_7]OGJ55271.1 MAG: hypothetical protein A2483_05130 [Candidatus Peregrinibacteria bacterium RIFOXYC2_FULL_33_13]
MNENEIIIQCKNGNLKNFSLLFDEYKDKIYRFIYFKTQHKETAEDLLSQTFIKALEHINQINIKKGSFKNWIYTIARNNVTDFYRKYKEMKNIDDVWDLDNGINLKDEVDNYVLIENVKDYMRELTPEQREIIMLRVWNDFSFSQIAEISGKSEASCKMMFKRSLEKIKNNFEHLLTFFLLFN